MAANLTVEEVTEIKRYIEEENMAKLITYLETLLDTAYEQGYDAAVDYLEE